jgi:hypothetical protein
VLQKFYRKDGYYEARNAKRTLAFPKKEAIFVMIKYRQFGPWNGE